MSTELSFIPGRIEIPDGKTKTSTYQRTNLLIASFAGGIENGQMLQLTISANGGHIQLTRESVKDLNAILHGWLYPNLSPLL